MKEFRSKDDWHELQDSSDCRQSSQQLTMMLRMMKVDNQTVINNSTYAQIFCMQVAIYIG